MGTQTVASRPPLGSRAVEDQARFEPRRDPLGRGHRREIPDHDPPARATPGTGPGPRPPHLLAPRRGRDGGGRGRGGPARPRPRRPAPAPPPPPPPGGGGR